MQTISINFIVPQGWHELSDKQLRYVYQLLADDFATDDKSCQREQSQASLDYAECSRQCDAIELLDQLGATLYVKAMTFKPYERISIFYWFAALKDTFSRKFPEFFVRVAPEAPYGDDFQPISAASGGNLLGSATPSQRVTSPKRKKSSRSILTVPSRSLTPRLLSITS